jgi:hypothetical protein
VLVFAYSVVLLLAYHVEVKLAFSAAYHNRPYVRTDSKGRRIPGPNSVEGRAAAAAPGGRAPEMPPVKNIAVVKSK